jgi:hypothetical protein
MLLLGIYSRLMSLTTNSKSSLSGNSECSASTLFLKWWWSRTRLDPSTKSETSWLFQQVPSRASSTQSHGRPSPTWPIPLGICIYSSRKFQEPLEAELSGSMRNFDLINTDLSMSGPFTLSIFFTLERKGMGGVLAHRRRQRIERFGNLLMAIVKIDLAQQRCDHSALRLEYNRK